MYEHRLRPPVSRRRFILRILRHFAAAMALLFGSITIGMAGYSHYEHLSWRDAFLNTAMLLGGMGPVDHHGRTAERFLQVCTRCMRGSCS